MKTFRKIRNWCLDVFFSKPFLFDLLFAILITSLTYYFSYLNFFEIELLTSIVKIASDVSASCITIAGFVLTILTIVISFKNSIDARNSQLTNEVEDENKSKIELFFTSQLYFKTVKILQQSITGLVVVFTMFLFINIFDKSLPQNFKFYTLIFGITIAILIFFRCILTLKLIIKLQMNNSENQE